VPKTGKRHGHLFVAKLDTVAGLSVSEILEGSGGIRIVAAKLIFHIGFHSVRSIMWIIGEIAIATFIQDILHTVEPLAASDNLAPVYFTNQLSLETGLGDLLSLPPALMLEVSLTCGISFATEQLRETI